MDFLDLVDYGPKNNKSLRYFSVTIEDCSKIAWTKSVKFKNAQTIKKSFANSRNSLERKMNSIEVNDGKEFAQKLLKKLSGLKTD